MSVSVKMPALGESVTEGTITRWLKQEGERVEADEPLLEVSTDKVDTEIPSPAAGILSKIVVSEDETVAIGAELAVIDGNGDSAVSAPTAPAATAAPAAEAQPAAPVAAPAPVAAATPTPAAASAPAGSAEGTVVTMPALGESVTEGTVTRWLKIAGETVEADEPLLEVSTDKVDTEIPSPVAGTVLELKVAEDETVPVGAALAVIGAAGSTPAAAPAAAPVPAPVAAVAPPAPAAPAPVAVAPVAAPIVAAPAPQAPAAASPAPTSSVDGPSGYVTPLVRKLAGEHGIDLAKLSGTGVGGRIRKQDVLDAVEAARKPAAPAPVAAPVAAATKAVSPAPARTTSGPSPLRGSTEKMSRLRSVIAKRMVESLQVSAQLTTVVEVDVTRIARLREQAKAEFQSRHGVKLSFLPFFALATIEALQAHPTLNATMDEAAGTITYPENEHLGIAVDTDRGLLVPVIRDSGDLNLAGIAKRIADLAERTRSNKVTPDELSGGTFTLTNTGSRGALFDTPIINQPQSAILGTGAVVKRAVVVDDPDLGEIILPRSMVYLALSYDHRLVDGADAARFLVTIKERLEAGSFEADLGL